MTEFIEILPGCPYFGFQTTIDLTCEEGLCWWIRQPINVVSSLAHLVVAFYFFRIGKNLDSKIYKSIGLIASLIAIASIGAHATHLKIFGTFDFTLQFLFMAYLIWINATRIGKRIPLAQWPFSLTLFIFLTIVQSIYPEASTTMYAFMLLALLGSEGLIYLKKKPDTNWSYRDFLKTAALFGAGLVCFFLDSERIICDPHNHWFQLHAVWHLLTAWSLIYLAKFYNQFN